MSIEVKINGKVLEKYEVVHDVSLDTDDLVGWSRYVINKKFLITHYVKDGSLMLAYRVLARVLGKQV